MPAEIVKDDDVGQVTQLNRLYFIATRWKWALDDLKRGDIGKKRMMEASDEYPKAPNFGSYSKREASAYLRKLYFDAVKEIDKVVPAEANKVS